MQKMPKTTFLDIGASVGSYTVAISKQNWKVIALEPSPSTFEMLKRNITRNRLTMSKLIEKQFGQQWAMPLYSSGNQEGDASLIQKGGNQETLVETITLDSLLMEVGHVGVAKVDIEGAEIEVFKASQKLDIVDCWIIETHVEHIRELSKLMQLKGYNCWLIEHLINGWLAVNMLFIKKDAVLPLSFYQHSKRSIE